MRRARAEGLREKDGIVFLPRYILQRVSGILASHVKKTQSEGFSYEKPFGMPSDLLPPQ
jgi:hypothetical protein